MIHNHSEVEADFPGLHQKIDLLREADTVFQKLFEDYCDVSKAIYRSEQRIERISESEIEKLRKVRLRLKNELQIRLLSVKN